jgi:hypothetical protein
LVSVANTIELLDFERKLLIPQDLQTNGFETHAEILCKVIKKGKY